MGRRAEIEARIAELREEKKFVKITTDGLKVSLNGTFGKLASRYSLLYAPQLMLRTTMTGQFYLLMLIEMLELHGIPVVSANTDGLVIKCPRDKAGLLETICDKWMKRTKMNLEDTFYSSLHSRDVNNYVAITTEGEAKTKGVFAYAGLMKNPTNEICVQAVIAYLTKGKSLKSTIRSSQDIRKFVTVRNVRGGGEKDGVYLGKVVRWYCGKGARGVITYKSNGNAVAKSEGSVPVMDLPDEFPTDIDYERYELEAAKMLIEIGAVAKPDIKKVPRKNSKAWVAAKDEGLIVENSRSKWEWSVHVQQKAVSLVL